MILSDAKDCSRSEYKGELGARGWQARRSLYIHHEMTSRSRSEMREDNAELLSIQNRLTLGSGQSYVPCALFRHF